MSCKLKTSIIALLILSNFQVMTFAQDIVNGDFESWTSNTSGILEPDSWETQNEPELIFVESSEGHSGKYSACMNVVWDNMMKKFTGASLSITQPVNADQKIGFLTGYCKGNSTNTDSLKIEIELFSTDKLIGTGLITIIQTAGDWTRFTVSIVYFTDMQPDKADISFAIIPVTGSYHQTEYCIDDLYFRKKNK